jgi:putative ABC transport system permease protein
MLPPYKEERFLLIRQVHKKQKHYKGANLNKIITLLKRQFKAHTVSLVFLLIGFIISILLISLGTSAVLGLQQAKIIKENATPRHALSMTYGFSKKIDFNTQIELIKRISGNSGVIVGNQYLYLNGSTQKYSLTAIFYQAECQWTYPYYDGRYFKPAEINQGANVVLIGQDLLGFTHQENDRTYLEIEGQAYEVIGCIGVKDQFTTWDSRILMPLTSVPESTRSEIETTGCAMILFNDKQLPMEDFYTLRDTIIGMDTDAVILANELSADQENILLTLLLQQDTLVTFTLLMYVIALINLVNITSYWIDDRRYEIGVRKAFGHNNLQIAVMLFSEMLLVLLTGCIIAIGLHLLLQQTLRGILEGYPLTVTYANWLTAISFTLASSLAATLLPIVKAMKIQPIEIMRK